MVLFFRNIDIFQEGLAVILTSILNLWIMQWHNNNSHCIFRFCDHENVWLDTKIKKNWVRYNLVVVIFDFLSIVAAILKNITFPIMDFLGLLICDNRHQVLPKSVKKPFVAIFLGSNHIFSRLL